MYNNESPMLCIPFMSTLSKLCKKEIMLIKTYKMQSNNIPLVMSLNNIIQPRNVRKHNMHRLNLKFTY